MTSPCRLLFIRHAETDLAGTFCGHTNPPVNARGLDQIHTLLKAIEHESIDAIHTSDLSRAVTTANAIGNVLGLVPTHEPGLREIHFGDWEGLTWSQIEQRDPAHAQRWLDHYPHLPAPHGEGFASFTTRVLASAKRLLTLPSHRSIAVVTHAGVMRVVLETLLGTSEQDAWAITKPYCSFFAYTNSQAAITNPQGDITNPQAAAVQP